MYDDQKLNLCEVFLRGILSLSDEQTSNEMWEQCSRHEWANYKWNAREEKIVLRNPQKLKVKKI